MRAQEGEREEHSGGGWLSVTPSTGEVVGFTTSGGFGPRSRKGSRSPGGVPNEQVWLPGTAEHCLWLCSLLRVLQTFLFTYLNRRRVKSRKFYPDLKDIE